MDNSAAEGARFQRASDQSLLIYFGHQITLDAHDRVRKLLALLETEPIPGVRNLHPAYCSVLVKFDPLHWHPDELQNILRHDIVRLENVRLPEPREVEILVCLGGGLGPNLIDLGSIHRIIPSNVN